MNVIVPILYGAVAIGLFAKRVNRATFGLFMFWVVLVMMKFYWKP